MNNNFSESQNSHEDQWGYTQEDRDWLNSDLSGLAEYDPYIFEPEERKSFTPVRYIPGKGFVAQRSLPQESMPDGN